MYNNKSNDPKTCNDLSSRLGTVLVTGGAGFIGSHLVDNLLSTGLKVKVLDNLSGGSISFLSKHFDNKRFSFLYKDLNDSNGIKEALKDVKTIFHLAAYPEVRTGFEVPDIPYYNNTQNTFYLLEQVRNSRVETFLFTSTSAVYGEPEKIPTSEDYGPIIPISPYAASKIAGEALICSYCHTYGFNGQIFRLANVVGSRSMKHGIIWDFIKKLKCNNKQLEILGNGLQSKSYIHVLDCVECFLFCLKVQPQKRIEIFNVGNDDKLDAIAIAKIVCKSMNLRNVEFITQGSVYEGGRGWIGDVKQMQLDISKLKKLGWKPQFCSMDAVTLASKELARDARNFNESKGI